MAGKAFMRAYEDIYEYLCGLTIIDAHEHFKPERDHLSKRFDFSWLFQYVHGDLVSAGLKNFARFDGAAPSKEIWQQVKPYWQHVKHASFATGVRMTIQELIGEDDLRDGNIAAIDRALNAANKPGLYKRLIQEQYGIERMISSNGTRAIEKFAYTDKDYEVMSLIIGIAPPGDRAGCEYYEKATGLRMTNCESLQAVFEKLIRDAAADKGVVGFKTIACPIGEYDKKQAGAVLKLLLGKKYVTRAQQAVFNRFCTDTTMGVIRKLGYPVAVHCGYWDDFTALDVVNWIGVVKRFADINFDLFHMSMPSTREAGFVGKIFPNAHVNMCWSPLISQRMFESSVDEWLDLVPVNKVSAFGGDSIYLPQAVHGYLTMCRQSLARVFAGRVEQGTMSLSDAKAILKMWMYDNPKRLYAIGGHSTYFR